MDMGTNPARSCLGHMWLLALLTVAVAVPAASISNLSMNSGASAEVPMPSTGQRALIEAHDTTGVGWWSSPAMDITPVADAAQETDTPLRPQTLPPASAYPRRTPGVESR